MREFDVLILGGGPAGLSAAIYAGRGNRSVAVIDSATIGGQPQYYSSIANYPGYVSIDSSGLVRNMAFQAESYNVEFFPYTEIERVHFLAGNDKEIVTDEEVFKGHVVIIATGAHPKLLNVPEEEKFRFNGISYCAICDGGFYKGKDVVVIGGGNSALEEALYLSKIAHKVYVIHRRDEFRADKVIQSHVYETMNIEVILNSTVKHLLGENKVTGVLLSDGRELKVDGVFPYIGQIPNSELFDGLIKTDKNGFIVTSAIQETNLEGVYAAGDVTASLLKQVVTATAEGAIAGTFALRYLDVK